MAKPDATPFDPQSAQAQLLEALDSFKQNIAEVMRHLEKSQRSSARWAQKPRERAALIAAAHQAARITTPCAIDNLTNFSCAFNAFLEAGTRYFKGDTSSLAVADIIESIAQHQAFQRSGDETKQDVNRALRDPAKIGLSETCLFESEPLTPHELVALMAAIKIQDMSSSIDLSQFNSNNRPSVGMSMGAAATA